MWRSMSDWYSRLPYTDPFQRAQAQLLQAILFILMAVLLAAVPVSLTATTLIERVSSSSLLVALVLILGSALILLRRGQQQRAAQLTVFSIALLLLLTTIPTGIVDSRAVFMQLAVPLVLAGLLCDRRTLAGVAVFLIVAVVAIAWLEASGSRFVRFAPSGFNPLLTTASFVLTVIVLALLVERFGTAFLTSLGQARQRQSELEALRGGLERQVIERTDALRQALDEVEQREQTLSETLANLRSSEATVTALSAPVIPVLPGVLVVPVIGTLDAVRSEVLRSKVLEAINDLRASSLIIDITGVVVVDEAVAEAVLSTAAACRLLGARVWLVGVRPEVAQTITTLQMDLGGIQTQATLQEAVQALLQRDGWRQGNGLLVQARR
jgi:anti-anti-sigma factor